MAAVPVAYWGVVPGEREPGRWRLHICASRPALYDDRYTPSDGPVPASSGGAAPPTCLALDDGSGDHLVTHTAVWDAAVRAAKVLPAVEHLRLNCLVRGADCPSDADALRALLTSLPRLRSVRFKHAVWDVPCLEALLDGLDACVCLQELVLEARSVSTACLPLIARAVRRANPGGVDIHLTVDSRNDRWTRRPVYSAEPPSAWRPYEAFLYELEHIERLTYLALSVPNMDWVPVVAIAAFLVRATKLTALVLCLADRPADPRATPIPVPTLTSAESEFKDMHTLSMSMGGNALRALLPSVVYVLHHAPTLHQIFLSELEEHIAGDVTSALLQCACLETVNLQFRAAPPPRLVAGLQTAMGGVLRSWLSYLMPPGGPPTPPPLLPLPAAAGLGAATVVAVARQLCRPSLSSLKSLRVTGGRAATSADLSELAGLVLHSPLLKDLQFERDAKAKENVEMDAALTRHLAWSSKRRREAVALVNFAGASAAAAEACAAHVAPLPVDSDAVRPGALAHELLLNILAMLAPADLVVCRRVARDWRAAVRELEDRDRPLRFACGQMDLPAFPSSFDECAFQKFYPTGGACALTPCSCGDVLVVGAHLDGLWGSGSGATQTPLRSYGSQHTSQFPPARWAVLAPLRNAAVALAAKCNRVDPHWMQLLDLWAGGRWIPAWIFVPPTVVRPTTAHGVWNIVAHLLAVCDQCDVNFVDRLWHDLADPASARRFYTTDRPGLADSVGAHRFDREELPLPLSVLTQRGASGLSDDWRDAWMHVHAERVLEDGRDDVSDNERWKDLVSAFRAEWPQYNLAFVSRVLPSESISEGDWDFLALTVRRNAALWRFARSKGRSYVEAFHTYAGYSGLRRFSGSSTSDDDALTEELDAAVDSIDTLSAHIRQHLRHACAVFLLNRQSWWLGGLSRDGHLVGVLCQASSS